MTVSKEDVRGIAMLARLSPGEDELERLTRELNGILEHIRVLETLDVSEADETATVGPSSVVFRDPGLGRDEMAPGAPAQTAPDWRDGFFVVPRLPALDGRGEEGERA